MYLEKDHIEPHVVDSRINSKTPCWGQKFSTEGDGSYRKNQLEKSSPPKKKKKSVSVENTTRLIEETKRVQRKASASLGPSYTTMQWLWMSFHIQHRTRLTQKEMSMSSPILSNDNNV